MKKSNVFEFFVQSETLTYSIDGFVQTQLQTTSSFETLRFRVGGGYYYAMREVGVPEGPVSCS